MAGEAICRALPVPQERQVGRCMPVRVRCGIGLPIPAIMANADDVRASFEHAKTETIEKGAGDADGSVGHRAASVGNNEGPGAMGNQRPDGRTQGRIHDRTRTLR